MEDLLQPYVPEDFDEFWAETTAEADSFPLDYLRRKAVFEALPGFEVELIDFKTIGGFALHGWIAFPKDMNGRLPAFLWVPAYGRESHLPNEYSTREGMVSMSFNFHGHAAFHQEEYKASRGYFAEGIEEPQSWIFRRMAQTCLIAMRILQAQLEADENRISVAGLSQGGGMAIWTGAHSRIAKSVVSDLPFLSAMRYTLSSDVYRYPLKEVIDFAETIPLGMQRIMHTISYFDTVNQATRLRLPTLVSFGQRDPAVRAETVRSVFSAIASPEKRLVEYETGHDWNPEMIPAGRAWMLSH